MALHGSKGAVLLCEREDPFWLGSSVTRCITIRVKRGIAALHPAGEKTLTTAPVRGGYPRPPGT